jgi:hypothetical protein
MNLFFWRKNRLVNDSKVNVTDISCEKQKLEEIKSILFPPLTLMTDMNSNGKLIKYHTDCCVVSNLEVVLNDLQDNYNDLTCQETLNSIIKRLLLVRKILGVETKLDEEAQYILVKNLNIGQNIEEIQ